MSASSSGAPATQSMSQQQQGQLSANAMAAVSAAMNGMAAGQNPLLSSGVCPFRNLLVSVVRTAPDWNSAAL